MPQDDRDRGGDRDRVDGSPLSVVLFNLTHDSDRDRVSIGDLLEALGYRPLGAMLLIFAVPNVLPVPPGTSAVLGTPLISWRRK